MKLREVRKIRDVVISLKTEKEKGHVATQRKGSTLAFDVKEDFWNKFTAING